MSSYLRNFTLFCLLYVVCVGILNFLIDPYAIWHNRCVEGVNCRKTQAGDKIYLTKAFQWKHLQPDIVIVGNSRPELGIDPESPQFGGKSVYNLGLRGAGVVTQAVYLANLLEHHQPERVIFNVDFLDFLQEPDMEVHWPPKRATHGYLDFDLFGNPTDSENSSVMKAKLQSLITLDALLASFKTILFQKQETNYTTRLGFNSAQGFIPIVKSEGTAALFDQKIGELRERLSGKSFSLYDSKGDSASVLTMKFLISKLEQKGIVVDVFISPYHRDYLSVIEETGHRDLFVAWKKQLAIQLEDIGYLDSNVLHDFSQMAKYSHEPVPAGTGAFMKWYWEPAHYTASLGEEIISYLASNRPFDRDKPESSAD